MRSGGQLLARLGRFNLVGLLGAALQLLLLCPAARYPLPPILRSLFLIFCP
jgi:putative flippase GtrA